jgi:hypothetical protein
VCWLKAAVYAGNIALDIAEVALSGLFPEGKIFLFGT